MQSSDSGVCELESDSRAWKKGRAKPRSSLDVEHFRLTVPEEIVDRGIQTQPRNREIVVPTRSTIDHDRKSSDRRCATGQQDSRSVVRGTRSDEVSLETRSVRRAR